MAKMHGHTRLGQGGNSAEVPEMGTLEMACHDAISPSRWMNYSYFLLEESCGMFLTGAGSTESGFN